MDVALPDGITRQPVSGVNLGVGTLGEIVAGGPTLLVFLRHFG
jgi:hypothetical protein